MSVDPFAAYKLPLGLSEGVVIKLEGTPASFTVRLPGTMNEDFNMELMIRLNIEPDEDGNSRVNAGTFQRIRRNLFFETCFLSHEGLPEGMSPAAFFAEYPLAARSIYERAQALASKADEEALVSLGKFASTPNGKYSGEAKPINTTKLSERASSQKQPVPN